MRALTIYCLPLALLLVFSSNARGQKKALTKKVLFYAITDDLKNPFISVLKDYTFYQQDTLVNFSVYDLKSLKNKVAVEKYLAGAISELNSEINFNNRDNDSAQLNYLLNFDYVITLQANKPLDKIIEFNIDLYKTGKEKADQNFPFLNRSSNRSKTVLLSESDLTSETLDKKITSAYRYLLNPEVAKPDFSILTSQPVILQNDTLFVKQFDSLTIYTSFVNESPLNYKNYSTVFSVFNEAKTDIYSINNEIRILHNDQGQVTLLFSALGVYKLEQKIYNSITNETINKYYFIKVKEGKINLGKETWIYNTENSVFSRFFSRKHKDAILHIVGPDFRAIDNASQVSFVCEGEDGYTYYKKYDSSNIRVFHHNKKSPKHFAGDVIEYSTGDPGLKICAYHDYYSLPVHSHQFNDEIIKLKNTLLFDQLYNIGHLKIIKYNSPIYYKLTTWNERYALGIMDSIKKVMQIYRIKNNRVVNAAFGVNLLKRAGLELALDYNTSNFVHIDTVDYAFSSGKISMSLFYRTDIGFGILNYGSRRNARYYRGFFNLNVGHTFASDITETIKDYSSNPGGDPVTISEKITKLNRWFICANIEAPVLYSLFKILVYLNAGARLDLLKTKNISALKKPISAGLYSNGSFSVGIRIPVPQ